MGDLGGIGVIGLGAASLDRNLRKFAPRALWLRIRLHAARRRAVAARLTTWRVPRFSTLPPLIRLSGHSPSQEANCFSVFHRLISTPTSEMIVCTVWTSRPATLVRSTPVMRHK